MEANAVLQELSDNPCRWLRSADSALRAGGSTGHQLIRLDRKNDWTASWIECVSREHATSWADSTIAGGGVIEDVDPVVAKDVDEITAKVTEAMTRMRTGEACINGSDYIVAVGEFFCWFHESNGWLSGGNRSVDFHTERSLYGMLCKGSTFRVESLTPSFRHQVRRLTDPDAILFEIRTGNASIGGGLTDTKWALSYRNGNYVADLMSFGEQYEEVVSEEKVRDILAGVWRRLR